MLWNKSESLLREIAADLVSSGDLEARSRAKLVIVELGSVGLSQALNCISLELPSNQSELARSIKHAAKMYETLREYRNYLAHGLYDISHYGILPTSKQLTDGVGLSDVMYEGPFAYIIGHTAKSESKLVLDFFTEAEIREMMAKFEAFHAFLGSLSRYTSHTVRMNPTRRFRRPRQSRPEAPQLPPMPKKLAKRSYGRQEGVGRGARIPSETEG